MPELLELLQGLCRLGVIGEVLPVRHDTSSSTADDLGVDSVAPTAELRSDASGKRVDPRPAEVGGHPLGAEHESLPAGGVVVAGTETDVVAAPVAGSG